MRTTTTFDVEPTNRCNADCYFCPRDQTPHQGLMTSEVFDRTLKRVIEFDETVGDLLDTDVKVSFCGLGEPLINPKTPEWVRRVREAGYPCVMASNGSLLDERRGRALLDAGLQQVNINVGEQGEEYEDIYKLPFERTRDNVLRFAEMAADECEVNIVVVDHRQDPDAVGKIVNYWKSFGLTKFVFFKVMNRGGALFVDHMQYESLPQKAQAQALLESRAGTAFCAQPFVSMFVGYDGLYYLCCADWKKEAPVGSVFDVSFVDVTLEKLRHVTSREPICKTCNWDPVNRVTEVLRAMEAGEATEGERNSLINDMLTVSDRLMGGIERLKPMIATRPDQAGGTRKLIPVSAE